MTTYDATKQGIARCCAGILHGIYLREQSPPIHMLTHTFTGVGVSFLSAAERVELAQLVITQLNLLLDKRYKVDSVIISSPTKDEDLDKILVTSNIRRR